LVMMFAMLLSWVFVSKVKVYTSACPASILNSFCERVCAADHYDHPTVVDLVAVTYSYGSHLNKGINAMWLTRSKGVKNVKPKSLLKRFTRETFPWNH
jgi:hypothetical protein